MPDWISPGRERIEAAHPFPLIGVVRIADPHGDGPGLHVAAINLPAIAAVVGAAAGKGGHSSIEARVEKLGKHAYQLILIAPVAGAYSRGWKKRSTEFWLV